jgi:hypothetical protein
VRLEHLLSGDAADCFSGSFLTAKPRRAVETSGLYYLPAGLLFFMRGQTEFIDMLEERRRARDL